MERYTAVFIVILVICALTAIDASSVVEKLKTRVRAPPLAMPSSNSMASLAQSEGSAGATMANSAVASSAAPGSVPVSSEAGSVESIAATKLVGSESGCESSCNGAAIQWGSVGSSSSSSSTNSGSDDLPPLDEVVGPIAAWIKAFKKRIGGGDDLAGTAKALVKPLIDKLKRNQQNAQDKLEQSNEAILDSVERSVTDHVLKLLKAEKITDQRAEQSEAKQAREEAVRDEQSEHELRHTESSEMEKLSSQISKSISELSQNPQSKSVLEHISQELSKSK